MSIKFISSEIKRIFFWPKYFLSENAIFVYQHVFDFKVFYYLPWSSFWLSAMDNWISIDTIMRGNKPLFWNKSQIRILCFKTGKIHLICVVAFFNFFSVILLTVAIQFLELVLFTYMASIFIKGDKYRNLWELSVI
jgi:hypothetical protein